jgi:hypothetical protein
MLHQLNYGRILTNDNVGECDGDIVICFETTLVYFLTLRALMSHIYGVHILDVSRSHTTTHHSR